MSDDPDETIMLRAEDLRRLIEEEVRVAFCGAGEADDLAAQVAPDVASAVIHRLKQTAQPSRR